MKKRCLFAVLLLFLSFCLSGCEFKDIDRRFFVTSIGVDKSKKPDHKFRVSLKVAIPKGQLKMGEEDFLVLAEDSDSITDAVQLMKARVDKEFDFGHTKVLVFGKSLVEDDFRDAIDWMVRQRFIQKIAWVMAGKPSAEHVLRAKQKSERLPSNALILAYGGTGVASQYIVSQYLFEFYRNTKERGKNGIMPVVEPMETYFRIDNALVCDDSKAMLTLTPEETKLYNVLSHDIEKSDFRVNVLNNTFMVHADSVKVHPHIQSSEVPTVVYELSFEGIVEERKRRVVIDEQVLNAVKHGMEQQMKKDVTELLLKLQKKKLDPLGLGLQYRASHWEDHMKEINDWKTLYPKAKFQVEVSCNLRASGAID